MHKPVIKLLLSTLGPAGVAILTLLLLLGPPYRVQGASRPERIFFTTFRPGNWDIYELSGPGKPARRLTDEPGLDYGAAPSPDGRWLVFTSERRGHADLFVLDLERGGPPRLLVDSDGMEDQAAISPDGKTLVFVSSREGNAEIFSLPFQPERTQSLKRVKNLTRHPGGDFRPAFSPDGKWIAFSSDRDNQVIATVNNRFQRALRTDLYMMNADGSEVRRLTNTPDWEGSPVFSTEAASLYFYSNRRAGTNTGFRIWAMGSDGSNPHPVSPFGNEDKSPAAIRDGRIVFASQIRTASGQETNAYGLQRGSRIISMKADGTDLREESDSLRDYWGPVAGPGGRTFCHGPGVGPESDLVTTKPGSLIVPPSSQQARLPGRGVAIYPVRSGPLLTPVPRRAEFLMLGSKEEDPDWKFVFRDMDGSYLRGAFSMPKPELGSLMDLRGSRDGNWITFMDGPFFGAATNSSDIWVVRTDGTQSKNLTANTEGNDGFPDFSGDARRIVFRSYRSGNPDIFLMNADGTGVRQLTDHPGRDTFPTFCPTRNEIAFISDRDGEWDSSKRYRTMDLYTLQLGPDGAPGKVRRLTDYPGHDSHPYYSSDGNWIVFTSEQGGRNDEAPLLQNNPQSYGEIYAIRIADRKLVRLTNNKWEDGNSSWVGPVE